MGGRVFAILLLTLVLFTVSIAAGCGKRGDDKSGLTPGAAPGALADHSEAEMIEAIQKHEQNDGIKVSRIELSQKTEKGWEFAVIHRVPTWKRILSRERWRSIVGGPLEYSYGVVIDPKTLEIVEYIPGQ